MGRWNWPHSDHLSTEKPYMVTPEPPEAEPEADLVSKTTPSWAQSNPSLAERPNWNSRFDPHLPTDESVDPDADAGATTLGGTLGGTLTTASASQRKTQRATESQGTVNTGASPGTTGTLCLVEAVA